MQAKSFVSGPFVNCGNRDNDYGDKYDLKRPRPEISALLRLVENGEETLERRIAAFAEYLSLKLSIFRRRVWKRLEEAGIPGDNAQDLVQQAAVKALSALTSGNYEATKGPFENWFSRVISNTVHDHLRRQRAERQALREASERGLLPGLTIPHSGKTPIAEARIEPTATDRIEARQRLGTFDRALEARLASSNPREKVLLLTYRKELELRFRGSWKGGVSLRRLYETDFIDLGWRATYEAFKRARQRAVKKVLDEARSSS